MLTQEKAICLLSNQHQALKLMHLRVFFFCCFFCFVFKAQWMEAARRKQGREGEEEGGGNARRRECDRVVMEGWGGREEGDSKSVGGGSLEERIREDREGSVFNLTTLFLCLCLPQPIQALFTHTHTHTHATAAPRYPGFEREPPGVKVSLRKLWQMWWYSLRKYFLCPSAAQVQRKQISQTFSFLFFSFFFFF